MLGDHTTLTCRRGMCSLVKAKRSFLSGEYGASVPFFVKSLEDPDNVIDVVKSVKYFPDKSMAMQILLRARDVGMYNTRVCAVVEVSHSSCLPQAEFIYSMALARTVSIQGRHTMGSSVSFGVRNAT